MERVEADDDVNFVLIASQLYSFSLLEALLLFFIMLDVDSVDVVFAFVAADGIVFFAAEVAVLLVFLTFIFAEVEEEELVEAVAVDAAAFFATLPLIFLSTNDANDFDVFDTPADEEVKAAADEETSVMDDGFFGSDPPPLPPPLGEGASIMILLRKEYCGDKENVECLRRGVERIANLKSELMRIGQGNGGSLRRLWKIGLTTK